MKWIASLIAATLLVTGAAEAQTQPARLVPFQARLVGADEQPLEDDVYPMTFRLYDTATGGTPCWTEQHETASVIGGYNNVLLGSLTPFPDSISFNPSGSGTGPCQAAGYRYLGITVATGQAGSGEEMVPRHQLVPSFHARRTDIADSVAANGVDTNAIRDGEVKSSDLAAGAVTSAKIQDGAIVGADLSAELFRGENGIRSDQIKDATIRGGSEGDLAQDTITSVNIASVDKGSASRAASTNVVGQQPNGQFKVIHLDRPDFDTDGLLDATGGWFNIRNGGLYVMCAGGQAGNGGSGTFQVTLSRLAPGTVHAGVAPDKIIFGQGTNLSGSSGMTIQTCAIRYLQTGDSVQLGVSPNQTTISQFFLELVRVPFAPACSAAGAPCPVRTPQP
ncbi:MAG TPA: hypothetical protein VEB21_18890 [Terriglobales bacterium]|nr:hypothetical protein [Terriglobales bacterium]